MNTTWAIVVLPFIFLTQADRLRGRAKIDRDKIDRILEAMTDDVRP